MSELRIIVVVKVTVRICHLRYPYSTIIFRMVFATLMKLFVVLKYQIGTIPLEEI